MTHESLLYPQSASNSLKRHGWFVQADHLIEADQAIYEKLI